MTSNPTFAGRDPKPAPPPRSSAVGIGNTHQPIYRRGDIWYVITNPEQPPVGTELWADRPAVIISNNISSNRSGFVQVIFLTTSTSKRTGPTHIVLDGVIDKGKPTMALCEQIHTVDVSRLTRKKGYVPESMMHDIENAIQFSLSMNHKHNDVALYRKWEAQLKTYGVNLAQEIDALSNRTTDERVAALTNALEIVTAQRDAYRKLYETRGTDEKINDTLAQFGVTLTSKIKDDVPHSKGRQTAS